MGSSLAIGVRRVVADFPGATGVLLEREARRVERFAAPELVDVDTHEDLQRVRESLAIHRCTGS